LDLSYITERIIVCSCPTSNSRKSLYRNSIEDLVHYLDVKHKGHWKIWNLREEFNDEYDLEDPLLRNRLSYVPWPDHQSPPFLLLQTIIDSIGEYIGQNPLNMTVIHCKLGKGRSGLVAIGVLMVIFGYSLQEADVLFTEKRMRSGFGSGLSIKSQRRFAQYLDLMKLCPYVNDIKVDIQTIRIVGALFDSMDTLVEISISPLNGDEPILVGIDRLQDIGNHVIVRLGNLSLPPDIKIVVRNRLSHRMNLSSSMAYMCFNMYWEYKAQGLDIQNGSPIVTTCSWDDMDGFKGSAKKGLRLFDSFEIYWTCL
jgi:protein-tyrosine phosphatase